MLTDKVAECERLMNLSADPRERAKLKVLRDIWKVLSDESVSLSPRQVTKQIAAIEELDSALDARRSMSTMFVGNPRPIFKPREINATLWYVEAEWPDGRVDEIGQFTSSAEAWRWIATESRAWFDAQQP
jgi:hypothetical protein